MQTFELKKLIIEYILINSFLRPKCKKPDNTKSLNNYTSILKMNLLTLNILLDFLTKYFN